MSQIRNSWRLQFFKSGEWQAIQERLAEMRKLGIPHHPRKENMFAALDELDPGQVKVVILGQDPYPTPSHATGVAFSIPSDILQKDFPPTLKIILQEYVDDLGFPYPTDGDLTPWIDQGVLLLNAVPVVSARLPSVKLWDEWKYIIWEILTVLQDQPVVIAALGGVAKSLLRPSDYDNFKIIEVGHPSPRGLNAKTPFAGSRIFSTINTKLREMKQEPIDWRL